MSTRYSDGARRAMRAGIVIVWASSVLGVAHGEPIGVGFSKDDWTIACDNTRTCRAAGYHEDTDSEGSANLPVSVLLTRKAGPNERVDGKLVIGERDPSTSMPSSSPLRLAMRVDGRAAGTVVIDDRVDGATLSAAQVAALLAAVTREGVVEWLAEGRRWRLSVHGANAVLLKMDDAQGRVGTRGALVRKGPRDEASVLPALPVPEIRKGALVPARPGDAALAADPPPTLIDALRDSRGSDVNCDLLDEPSERNFEVVRLTERKLLVSTPCWRAAYNNGSGYWVVEDSPPWRPVLVTDAGTDFRQGEIGSMHKGRGIGDCVWTQAWTWDGVRFVHSEASSGGLCKGLEPGGAWTLPTLVTRRR